ncbi:hypothetical protein Taro_041623 [Colocasia esculenta]|uniref:Uncharacterized protein n=1 Tax=Colocasia esculenta TaxID=4460 RepID=A0A843WWD6_COLES|nr:hypothetical protein [Colocasia esculenta]
MPVIRPPHLQQRRLCQESHLHASGPPSPSTAVQLGLPPPSPPLTGNGNSRILSKEEVEKMVSGSERSSHDGSRLRRHRTLSVPLPPTSQLILPPPTAQVHLHCLHHLGGGALAVKGRLGELQRGGCLMDNNGIPPSSEDMLLVATKELIFRDLQHFNGKSLDDAIASVAADVHLSGWQTMCEMWTKGDGQIGRCKHLADGSESWVDEESRRRYETMTQLMTPSSDVDAESHTPATPEEAFISVMRKDRPAHVRCAGSGETLSTWYKSIGTSGSLEQERIMQE